MFNMRMSIRITASQNVCKRSGNFRRLALSLLIALLAAPILPTLAIAEQDAPGRPGAASRWAPAAKDFLGASTSTQSRVYFTGAEGIVTEVFYPTVDQVQNVDLQLLIVDARTAGFEDAEERKQKRRVVSLVNNRAPIWQVETTDGNERWKIVKKIYTDPRRNSLVERITLQTLEPGKPANNYRVFILNNPAINNSGGGEYSGHNDNSRTLSFGGRTMLVASEPNSTSSALAVSRPWTVANGKPMVSNGFVGRNDGWADLFGGANDRTMDWTFDIATDGNVAQMGCIDLGDGNQTSVSFDVVLAFGSNEREAMETADATLDSDIAALEAEYIAGWKSYTDGLNNQKGLADDQYYLAAMALKCVQDKSNGAMVAGLGTPWGEEQRDDNSGGYHLVWARDLFKFASALLTAGDVDSAVKAVDYLFSVQMQTANQENPYSRAGRFPQNTHVDGTCYWNGTQMDETAMPIILAWKVHQVRPLNLEAMWPKIKMAAEFLAHTGPRTSQERWEEMGGYSPSTIAAEIAGLVCAAALANDAHDPDAAKFYLEKADQWRNNVANWTFTTNGLHGDGKYYLRITSNQDPNDDVQLVFGNNVGTHGERYIIDGGFLELVRMGVMSPEDWTIRATIPEYDDILKDSIPGKGDAFFRYNYDGYGERDNGLGFDGRQGRGRLWPIFSAERGIYEIARTGDGSAGKPYLAALKAFSSPVGFIPEQVWNQRGDVTGWKVPTPPGCTPGTATRSMQPLNWAMGEYINLVAAMNSGRSDAPQVVVSRYGTDKPQTTVTFNVVAPTHWGQSVYLVGDHPLLGSGKPASGVKLSPSRYPVWSTTISLPAETKLSYRYAKIDEQGGDPIWDAQGDRQFTTGNSGTETPPRDDTF